jgi:hypothetical protein
MQTLQMHAPSRVCTGCHEFGGLAVSDFSDCRVFFNLVFMLESDLAEDAAHHILALSALDLLRHG